MSMFVPLLSSQFFKKCRAMWEGQSRVASNLQTHPRSLKFMTHLKKVFKSTAISRVREGDLEAGTVELARRVARANQAKKSEPGGKSQRRQRGGCMALAQRESGCVLQAIRSTGSESEVPEALMSTPRSLSHAMLFLNFFCRKSKYLLSWQNRSPPLGTEATPPLHTTIHPAIPAKSKWKCAVMEGHRSWGLSAMVQRFGFIFSLSWPFGR
jgi:hypothetical protein